MVNNNSLTLFVIITILGFINAQTPIRQCNNGKPLPLMVQVDDCSELPCSLWKGENSNIGIQFVATKNSMENMYAVVHLSTLGAHIPYELDETHSDICGNLMFGAYCPLDTGEDVTYHLEMPIIDQQPEVRTKLEISLVDRNDNSVVSCFVTDAQIRRQRNSSEQKQ